MERSEFDKAYRRYSQAYAPRFRPALLEQHYKASCHLSLERLDEVLNWCSDNYDYPATPATLKVGMKATYQKELPDPSRAEESRSEFTMSEIREEIAKIITRCDENLKKDLILRGRGHESVESMEHLRQD